jgi:hypothetical protein
VVRYLSRNCRAGAPVRESNGAVRGQAASGHRRGDTNSFAAGLAGVAVSAPHSLPKSVIVSLLGTAIACLALVLVSLCAVYPSFEAASWFIAYVLVFNLLPGLLAARLLLPRMDDPGILVIFSLALGIVAHLLVLIPLWTLDTVALMPVLPLAAIVGLIAGFRRLALLDVLAGWRVGRCEMKWVVGTAFLCMTALLGMANVLSDDPGDGFSFHFAFQGVIVRGLERGWPPPNLLIPHVPLSYNYAAHLWILGASQITGLPIDVLVARYAPVFLGGSAAAAMMAFGRSLLGLPWWLAGLAVTCAFWIVGVPPIAAAVFGTFMPFGATLLLSPFLAIVVYFATIAFVAVGRPSRGAWRYLILVAMMFVATGARGVCPPILLSGLALRLFLAWRANQRWPWQETTDLLAAFVGFILGLRLFFTLGSDFSGTGFIRFTGQPFQFLADPTQYLLVVPHLLIEHGLSSVTAGALAFALIAIFQAGFLAPTLPVEFAAMRRHADPAGILLLASAIAGIAAVFVTEAPGYSHFSILYFANVALPLLGARGLHLLLAGRCWSGGHRTAVLMSLGLTTLLATLHFAQLPWRTLDWLGHTWPRTAAALLTGRSLSASPIAACRHDGDADLFDLAAHSAPDPIVIMLPKQPSGSSYCEAFWLVVRTPIQIVSQYALTFIPGAASPPLNQILATLAQHMTAASILASRGILSVSDLVAIAGTLKQRRAVFIFADSTLIPSSKTDLEWLGSNDGSTLWRVRRP